MTHDMQIFNYGDRHVRMVENAGEPWWVLKDVCGVLGIVNPTQAAQRLDDDERAMFDIGRQGKVNCVNESGLYSVILRSDKPEAKKFKRWITHEVLPSIRKYGLYADPALLAAPELLVKAGEALIAAREDRQTLEKQIELDAPKVAFADAVTESGEVISFGQMAKILRENGIDIGRTRLCAELRGLGLLVSQRCVDYNTPTQKAANLKLFRLCARQHVFPDGRSVVKYATRVTGKGQQWILGYFRRKRVA